MQSENGEPVKKEATFDDIIMLVFFLNQDPKCKDSRYKVGQRLFVGTDSPIIVPILGVQVDRPISWTVQHHGPSNIMV